MHVFGTDSSRSNIIRFALKWYGKAAPSQQSDSGATRGANCPPSGGTRLGNGPGGDSRIAKIIQEIPQRRKREQREAA